MLDPDYRRISSYITQTQGSGLSGTTYSKGFKYNDYKAGAAYYMRTADKNQSWSYPEPLVIKQSQSLT